MNEPQLAGRIAAGIVDHMRVESSRTAADRQVQQAFKDGLHAGERRGRNASLGWLFVGAASGFLAGLAFGFAVFW